MKYYILGKSENFTATKDNDSNLLEKYWEFGWELGVGRNVMIQKLMNNEIDNENITIVTIEDRMFLYQEIFKNVMSYEYFSSLDKEEADINYDLVNHEYILENHMKPFDLTNKNFIDIVLKTKKETILTTEKKFFVIHYRERPWGNYRNINTEDYFRIIQKIINMGYDFFIYGKNADSIGNKYGKSELTLSQANTYLLQKNCIGFIGPLSGGSMIALLSYCGKHHILDVGYQNRNDHPLYHGDVSNFIKAEIINYNNIDNFLENLN
jgi:hypothetical protein